MKKFFTIVASAILVGASTFAAIDWNSGNVENIAKGATVTVSSKFVDAQAITDDNDGSGWQAVSATHEFTNDWVLIDLGAEKTFTDLEIKWEASHCYKYSVYVSNDAPEFTESGEGDNAYKKINEDWLNGKTAAATGGDETEVNYTENITFKSAQTGQYVLIYANEYNKNGKAYGMRIFEVRLANIGNRDEISSLKATQEGNAMAGGDAVNVTLTLLNMVGEEVTNADAEYTLTCDDEAVSITGNANVFAVKASKAGSYTLKATAVVDDKTLEASHTFTAAFNWTGIENIATGKPIQGRVKAGTDDLNPVEKAVDGNEETFYQYNGEWGGGDSWLLVDLGAEYMVDAIGASYGDLSGGQCVFGYATDATAIQNKIEESADFVWADNLAENEGWTFTGRINRSPNATTTQMFNAPVKARYIVVRDADNPDGKPCVNEIYVSGIKREAEKADKIEISLEKGGMVIGETNTITASVLDQYGMPFTGDVIINVDGAKYNDGTITAEKEGMVTVTATCGELSQEAKFYVADQENYCAAGAEVIATSEGAAEDTNIIFDGGKDINTDGAGNYVLANSEAPGEHEHWFIAKLAKPYDIHLIALNWEGACPAEYDIYLGENKENLQLFYSEKHAMEPIAWKDRFSGKDMKNIQFIKVVTKKNATQYGIKLHDMKVYGTSEVVSEATTIEASNIESDVYVDRDVKLSAVVKDQFGAPMDVEVKYTCDDENAAIIEGNIFKASALGEYTVVANYGKLTAEIKIKVNKKVLEKFYQLAATQYATLILPFDAEIPEGYEVYSVTGQKESGYGYTVLEMKAQENIKAYMPYVIFWNKETEKGDGVCRFVGDITTESDETVYENGWMRGVLVDSKAPVGSYVLLNQNEKLGFYKVATDDIKVNAYHAYLEPKNANEVTAFVFNLDGVDAIENIATSEALVNVYDMNGVLVRKNVKACEALQGLQKGIYVVNGAKKAVK